MNSYHLATLAALAMSSVAHGQSNDVAARRAELLRQRAAIDAQLQALDPAILPARQARSEQTNESGDIIVTGKALPLTTAVTGQTVTTVDDSVFRNTPATTIADIVRLSPGVVVIQGNGPRDVGVSVRGSNARNAFGARNIQVFEDDFPVTQPDGLARFDLTDPHAYGAVDVVRGPSSARYGNYALGGAVNFRTRRGRDIRGVEVGTDVGGDGYANVYATIGHAGPRYEYSLFGSMVGANGATGHSGYQTGTINAYGTFAFSDRNRVAAKVIYNEGEFRLSTRLSYNQYLANPYQQGCGRAAMAAAGCGTIAVLVNGTNGGRIVQTAGEGDLARDDRRTIVGTRYEHDFGVGDDVADAGDVRQPGRQPADQRNAVQGHARQLQHHHRPDRSRQPCWGCRRPASSSCSTTTSTTRAIPSTRRLPAATALARSARRCSATCATSVRPGARGAGADADVAAHRRDRRRAIDPERAPDRLHLPGRRQSGADADPGRATLLERRARGGAGLAGDRCRAPACPHRHRLRHPAGGAAVRDAAGDVRQQCRPQDPAQHRHRPGCGDRAR